MTYRNRIRMLNVAERRLRRAKHFLVQERTERAVNEIEATIVIMIGVFGSLNSYKKTKHPWKGGGGAKNKYTGKVTKKVCKKSKYGNERIARSQEFRETKKNNSC